MLEVCGVSKTYFDKGRAMKALSDVSFTMNDSQVSALTGPSGAGKTTLLNLIAGLDKPDEDGGRVLLQGKRIDSLDEQSFARLRSSSIGIIFQNPNLVGHLNILENVLLPTLFSGGRNGEGKRKELALALLSRLGLADLSRRMPSKLSEGERRRASVARALVTGPRLVLADEPTINLDEENARIVLEILKEETEERKAGVLLSTHDMDIAKNSDQILRLKFGKVVRS